MTVLRSGAQCASVLRMPNPTRRQGARKVFDHDPARLRARRVELGLHQAAVAEAAGISAGTLSELERGTRNPSPPVLLRLAEALQCSTKDLMPAEPQAAGR